MKEMENVKQEYVPPRLEVIDIKMENSIATGSATMIPPGSVNGGGIQHEWKAEAEKKWDIYW